MDWRQRSSCTWTWEKRTFWNGWSNAQKIIKTNGVIRGVEKGNANEMVEISTWRIKS